MILRADDRTEVPLQLGMSMLRTMTKQIGKRSNNGVVPLSPRIGSNRRLPGFPAQLFRGGIHAQEERASPPSRQEAVDRDL